MRNHLTSRRQSWRTAATLSALLALSACATTGQEQLQSRIDSTQRMIAAAQSAGADRYAPDTLRSAQSNLSQAQQLMADGKTEDATRSLKRAAADAELAQVQTEAGAKNAQAEALRKEVAGLMQ